MFPKSRSIKTQDTLFNVTKNKCKSYIKTHCLTGQVEQLWWAAAHAQALWVGDGWERNWKVQGQFWTWARGQWTIVRRTENWAANIRAWKFSNRQIEKICKASMLQCYGGWTIPIPGTAFYSLNSPDQIFLCPIFRRSSFSRIDLPMSEFPMSYLPWVTAAGLASPSQDTRGLIFPR